MADDLPIDERHTIPAAALDWTAVRASGPGGQHVNRTASKVRLRLDVDALDWLDPRARTRLRQLAGDARLDADGSVIISSQATRDQTRNLEDARARLADLVRRAMVRPKRRIATRPSRGAKERRLKAKQQRGQTKRMRGRVRRDED